MQKQIKAVKGWGCHCSEQGVTRAYNDYSKARAFTKMLNDEYDGTCSHRVIPVLITPLIAKKKKK
jgi:hypothetical protein